MYCCILTHLGRIEWSIFIVWDHTYKNDLFIHYKVMLGKALNCLGLLFPNIMPIRKQQFFFISFLILRAIK